MHVDTYVITKDDKEVWRGFAQSEGEALAVAEMESKTDKSLLKAEIVQTPETTEELSTEQIKEISQNLKKTRKPRADKGLPRAKAEKIIKKRRTVYHLVTGTVQTFEGKDELDEALSGATELSSLKVIDGGTVRQPNCQKTWKLT